MQAAASALQQEPATFPAALNPQRGDRGPVHETPKGPRVAEPGSKTELGLLSRTCNTYRLPCIVKCALRLCPGQLPVKAAQDSQARWSGSAAEAPHVVVNLGKLKVHPASKAEGQRLLAVPAAHHHDPQIRIYRRNWDILDQQAVKLAGEFDYFSWKCLTRGLKRCAENYAGHIKSSSTLVKKIQLDGSLRRDERWLPRESRLAHFKGARARPI